MKDGCAHLDQLQDLTPGAQGCEDCLLGGGRWLHLRLCLTCGHGGCCDSSSNKNATKHYDATKHPMIRSFEPGEEWMCFYKVNEIELAVVLYATSPLKRELKTMVTSLSSRFSGLALA